MEAPTRFELVMGALQAPALPLGYGAPCGEDYGDSAPPCQLSRTLYGRPLRQDSCEPESPRNRCGARLDTPRGVVYISCGPLGSSSMVERLALDQDVGGSSPPSPASVCGPFVQRLGHRPLTSVTGVRFPYGLPLKASGREARPPALYLRRSHQEGNRRVGYAEALQPGRAEEASGRGVQSPARLPPRVSRIRMHAEM